MYSFNQFINFGTDGTTCRVEKDDLCNNKCRTKGVFLAAYNCGIVCGYREIFTAESLSQVTMFLLDMISFSISLPQYIIYMTTLVICTNMSKIILLINLNGVKNYKRVNLL